MTSILTNTSAMSALQALTATQRGLSKTQAQISSGLAVAEASDNAAYWSIATEMRARVAGLDAAQKGLSLTRSIADVTSAAIAAVIDSVKGIQADVVLSSQSGVDVRALQGDVAARQASIMTILDSASFNGVNWLKQDADYTVADTQYYNIHIGITNAQDSNVNRLNGVDLTIPGPWTDTDESYEHVVVIAPDKQQYEYSYDTNTRVEHYDVDAAGHRVLVSDEFPTATIVQSSTDRGAMSGGDTRLGVDTSRFTLLTNVKATFSQGGELYWTDYPEPPAFNPPSPGIIGTFGRYSFGNPVPNTGYQFIDRLVPSSPLSSIMAIDLTDHAQDHARTSAAIAASMDAIVSIAASVGALQTQISNQQTYNSTLSDALTSGIGSLVDADMNVASTRLQALQTQQQLGIQALSIANENGQLILKLFQAA